jgi:hypothetical protein
MALWRQGRGKYGALEAKKRKIWSFEGKVEENIGIWRLCRGK